MNQRLYMNPVSGLEDFTQPTLNRNDKIPIISQFVAVVGHVFPDIDVQNEDGDTALHLAAEFDQPNVIETLLKHKADFHKVHHEFMIFLIWPRNGAEVFPC